MVVRKIKIYIKKLDELLIRGMKNNEEYCHICKKSNKTL